MEVSWCQPMLLAEKNIRVGSTDHLVNGSKRDLIVFVARVVSKQADLYSAVIVRTFNALNALVSSKQIRLRQTSETICTDRRVPGKIRERVPDCEAGN